MINSRIVIVLFLLSYCAVIANCRSHRLHSGLHAQCNNNQASVRELSTNSMSAPSAWSTRSFIEEDSSEAKASRVQQINYWVEKDPENLFLTEVTGESSLSWVNERNAHSAEMIGSNLSETELYQTILKVLDSKEKIPHIRKDGEFYYNFWQDEQHPRGIFRRTTWESYVTKEPEWEIIFDVDELCKAENESWVYKGSINLPTNPHINPHQLKRRLILLSKGGSDAFIIRELDMETLRFLDETPSDQATEIDKKTVGSFTLLHEAKHNVVWKDADTVLIGTNIPSTLTSATEIGSYVTKSGYPRIVREWKRGTKVSEAKIIAIGSEDDVIISGQISKHHDEYVYQWTTRALTFYTNEVEIAILADPALPSSEYSQEIKAAAVNTKTEISDSTLPPTVPSNNDNSIVPPLPPSVEVKTHQWYKLHVPLDCQVDDFADQLLVLLRSNWTPQQPSSLNSSTSSESAAASSETSNSTTKSATYLSGSLLSIPLKPFLSHQSLGKILC
jgi:hypothetical protein